MSEDTRKQQALALQGGMKAVSGIEGQGEPKIGVEEFMSLAERFGFSEGTLAKIESAVKAEDMGAGPFLGNYYADMPETKNQAFQRAAREMFDVPYALAVSSGTGALHAAFVAAGVGPGTEVICPAIGFYATAAAVVMARGVPIFCDVDESLHMDPKKIESLITPRTVALAPTHVMGGVCDMDPILEVAKSHDIKVVEDCAQTCGGTYNGRSVGSLGDIGCFSISSYKIVGGGEGGLLIMSDERLWDRANCLAEGGGLWRPDRFGPPRYEGELFVGTNYRLSELEAAVDVPQMAKLPATLDRFRSVKNSIVEQLDTYSEIRPQKTNDADGDVGYMLRFFPETIELGGRIVEALNAEGVECGMRGEGGRPDWHIYHGMFPIMLRAGATKGDRPFDDPIYTSQGGEVTYSKGDCPVADDLFDRVITIGLNQWYTATDCTNVAEGINKVLTAYCTQDPSGAKW